MTAGTYTVTNLFGCSSGQGSAGQCGKFVSSSTLDRGSYYLTLTASRDETWQLVATNVRNVFSVKTCDKKCWFWHDTSTATDWTTLRTQSKAYWLIEPKGDGYAIRLYNCRSRCHMTWKSSTWGKYLYTGDDEGVTFDFVDVNSR